MFLQWPDMELMGRDFVSEQSEAKSRDCADILPASGGGSVLLVFPAETETLEAPAVLKLLGSQAIAGTSRVPRHTSAARWRFVCQYPWNFFGLQRNDILCTED